MPRNNIDKQRLVCRNGRSRKAIRMKVSCRRRCYRHPILERKGRSNKNDFAARGKLIWRDGTVAGLNDRNTLMDHVATMIV